MSGTPARSTLDAPPLPAGRLAFRVRLPAVSSGPEPQVASHEGSSEPTRGMKVLSGIIEKRSQSGWRRVVGRRGPHRMWLLSLVVIVLSGVALVVGLTNEGGIAVEPPDGDVFANDEFDDLEATPGVQAVAPHVVRPQPAPDPRGVTGSEPSQGSRVQAAVYHTTERFTARPAWLDGTILTDDSHAP